MSVFCHANESLLLYVYSNTVSAVTDSSGLGDRGLLWVGRPPVTQLPGEGAACMLPGAWGHPHPLESVFWGRAGILDSGYDPLLGDRTLFTCGVPFRSSHCRCVCR